MTDWTPEEASCAFEPTLKRWVHYKVLTKLNANSMGSGEYLVAAQCAHDEYYRLFDSEEWKKARQTYGSWGLPGKSFDRWLAMKARELLDVEVSP